MRKLLAAAGSFFSPLSVFVSASSAASLASGIPVGHDPSTIIFRSALAHPPFLILAFIVLICYITAFTTVSLLPSERPLIYPPRTRILDAVLCPLSLFSEKRSAFFTGVSAHPILNLLR